MTTPTTDQKTLPPLVDGERLDQPTFHERYEAMPEGTRAELIGGVVHMHSPAKRRHGLGQSRVARWLGRYQDATPGTETYVDLSALIGPESEPQPDVCLLIAPECGGQITDKDDWAVGVPELVVEVANTTEATDLNAKKADYLKGGAKEYVVVAVRQRRLYWFVNREEAMAELPPGPDGLYRSETFPGLWLDPGALLNGDMQGVHAATDRGLATPEHAAFVADLTRRKGVSP